MGDTLKALFSDESYCRQEIVRIREAWGNRTTFTPAMIDSSRRVLGFMKLYGPDSIQVSVDATELELARREILCLIHGRLSSESPAARAEKPQEGKP